MKLARIKMGDDARVGVIVDDRILLLPSSVGDVVSIIERGEEGIAEVQSLVSQPEIETVALSLAVFLPPIDRFRRDILCTGWNYHEHYQEGQRKREGKDAKELPTTPTFFTKGPDTVIGPNDPIAFDPKLSSRWDYEAEVALVIGKTGRSIPEDQAEDYIFGYCLANDVSQRDLQRRHGGQWLKGKSIDQTMPLGPFIATKDEIQDLSSIRLECILNGEVMQDAVLAQMAFPVARLISELSFGMTLNAGDVILTGTPSGVGFARDPAVFLAEGDHVVVRASGLGELSNRLELTDLVGGSNVVID